MQQVNLEQYAQALNSADSDTKNLVNSDLLYDCLSAEQKTAQVSISVDDMLLPFGYFFLNLVSMEDLVSELTKLGIQNPQGFLDSVVARAKTTQTAPSQPSDSVPPSPVRTMEDDKTTAQEGQTFSSSQDALLNKQNPHQ